MYQAIKRFTRSVATQPSKDVNVVFTGTNEEATRTIIHVIMNTYFVNALMIYSSRGGT